MNLVVSKELLEKVTEVAKVEKVSVTSLIVRAIWRFLDEYAHKSKKLSSRRLISAKDLKRVLEMCRHNREGELSADEIARALIQDERDHCLGCGYDLQLGLSLARKVLSRG